ncbi:hypothetical protein ACFQ1Q_06830 [Winogradskyella litorisediminis]|uniref:DUF1508 domain-containing protein n=1 Tax=Winogradskyella litorisediminis TaxID=1156618 RepID=A0ABW3N5H5_9FLAO
MVNFTVFESKGKECRILIKSNDTIEFVSRYCTCRSEAVSLIMKIRKNAQQYDAYKIKKLECGSWRFELIDMAKNEILGQSATEISLENLNRKINEMRVIVPSAKVQSETVNY